MQRKQCAGCDAWFTGEGYWCPKCKRELDEVSDNAKARTKLNLVTVDVGSYASDCADSTSENSNTEPLTANEV